MASFNPPTHLSPITATKRLTCIISHKSKKREGKTEHMPSLFNTGSEWKMNAVKVKLRKTRDQEDVEDWPHEQKYNIGRTSQHLFFVVLPIPASLLTLYIPLSNPFMNSLFDSQRIRPMASHQLKKLVITSLAAEQAQLSCFCPE